MAARITKKQKLEWIEQVAEWVARKDDFTCFYFEDISPQACLWYRRALDQFTKSSYPFWCNELKNHKQIHNARLMWLAALHYWVSSADGHGTKGMF